MLQFSSLSTRIAEVVSVHKYKLAWQESGPFSTRLSVESIFI